MAKIEGMEDGKNARADMLWDWLCIHHAQCNWQQRVKRVGMLECWTANGRVFMVQHYERLAGWEIYIPAHAGTSTIDTLAAATRYIRGEVKEDCDTAASAKRLHELLDQMGKL